MKLDVIILAGGLGTRLASVVTEVPKPMAPVAGKPFLDHILSKLPIGNINKIILAVGYKFEKIEEYYGLNYKGIALKYSIETEPLGTGGAIGKALKEVEKDNVLIINGDTFFDVNMEEMWQAHNSSKKTLTLALKQISNPDRYGTVLLESDTIVRFQEKQEGVVSGLINGGVYLAKKQLLEVLPKEEKYSFESEVLEKEVLNKSIGGYISKGLFIDIGIPTDYEKAQSLFA